VALAPRETEVTVLFCDLRGFSRASERAAADLMGLLERVSQALGVATHQIRAEGGVVGDFHGDAAMGFWGWPLAQPDAALRAARAALAIRTQFSQSPQVARVARQASNELPPDFQVGIGIATGNAVAGKIGTVDQVKVTVFGPVVNLAARLEGMTKVIHAPILLDERTASVLQNRLPAEAGRLRRVAAVRPYGLEQSLVVSELIPSLAVCPQLADADLAEYEQALDDFVAGNWQAAFDRLQRVPPTDGVKDFLTAYMTTHERLPPPNWTGVIAMVAK
jgi:adenylate cyclase